MNRKDRAAEELVNELLRQIGEEVYPRHKEIRDDIVAYAIAILIFVGLPVLVFVLLLALIS